MMRNFAIERYIATIVILFGASFPSQAIADKTAILEGRCVDNSDHSPVAGVDVRLFQFTGRSALPVEIAATRSNANGAYKFPAIESPPLRDPLNPITYWAIGDVAGRPLGLVTITPPSRQPLEMPLWRDQVTLRGRVVDQQNRPVAGASVARFANQGVAIPGVLSGVTDDQGEFVIERVLSPPPGDQRALTHILEVRHPDFPGVTVESFQKEGWLIRLAPGCVATGTVVDDESGQPIVSAVVTFERVDVGPQERRRVEGAGIVDDADHGRPFAITDAAGRFRAALPAGRYDVSVDATDRVIVARLDQALNAGETSELPPLRAIEGGFLLGRVVDEAGAPITRTLNGELIQIGLFGPSVPTNPKVLTPVARATVDDSGRFILRAAPGENFPYFVNMQGDRMAWNTRKRPPLTVRPGETTIVKMRGRD